MNNKEYYQTKNEYLAKALNFLGFKYYKFNNETGIIYSFKITEDFNEVKEKFFELKKRATL